MDVVLRLLEEYWLWTLTTASVAFLGGVAINDLLQKKRTILHNFPIVGHLRYLLEKIGPELRQYWVSNDKEELPFNRSERSWIYASAKGQNNTFGFGTSEQIQELGYPIIKQATLPFPENKAKHPADDPSAVYCLKTVGAFHKRKFPFRPRSVINVSAMSFGALGYKAVSAINKGAAKAGCYHNTGEGGLSPYHLLGADVVFQLGTGYFGARDKNGKFSMELLREKTDKYSQIRMLEIKLSQGAKPGKGGILPAAKVTAEIAAIRGVPQGKDCASPNFHSEFGTVDQMIDFIERVSDQTGLPVGVKSAIGETEFWRDLAKRMRMRNCGPDFITIDGGEGGTGAAPLTFADHVALPFKVGFARVYKIFQEEQVSDRVVWIGSAKLGFPDRAITAFAMGCDLVNVAREAMISIGCIQAQKCHTGHCPTGVATHNGWLQAGLNIDDKAERFARYIKSCRKELLSLAHCAGYEHPCQFTGRDIELTTGVNEMETLEHLLGYKRDKVHFTSMLENANIGQRTAQVQSAVA